MSRLLLIVFVFYAAICASTLEQVRAFRSRPSYERPPASIDGRWPHQRLARAYLFKRGTFYYHLKLREWLYRRGTLADTPANRQMLEADLATMSPHERRFYLSQYPLTMTEQLVPLMIQTLDGELYDTFLLIDAYDAAHNSTHARDWFDRHVVSPGDTRRLLGVLPWIVRAQTINTIDALSRFWPSLTPDAKRQVVSSVADHFQTTDERRADEMVDWALAHVPRDDGQLAPATARLLGRCVISELLRGKVLVPLEQQVSTLDPHVAELIVESVPDREIARNTATVLYRRAAEVNPGLAIAMLRIIARRDLAGMEDLARPVVAGPDSTLRKGAIVVLVTHGSAVGQAYLDEAFSGGAPRTTLFRRTFDYIYGSKAADRYRAIAGHDYLETGKTWPPTGSDLVPCEAEGAAWREFIDTYPWFPGTDDAYYRLAYARYACGDVRGTLEVVDEAMNRTFPDRDALPHLGFVMRVALADPAAAQSAPPAVRHLHAVMQSPVARLILEGGAVPAAVRDALEWLEQHRDPSAFFAEDAPVVPSLKTVIDALDRADQQRMTSITNLLKEDARLLPGILYGSQMIPAAGPARSRVHRDDPAFSMMTTVANDVAQALRGEGRLSVPQDAIVAFVLVHAAAVARLGSGCASCGIGDALSEAFDSPFELVSRLPPSGIPKTFADEHRTLLLLRQR